MGLMTKEEGNDERERHRHTITYQQQRGLFLNMCFHLQNIPDACMDCEFSIWCGIGYIANTPQQPVQFQDIYEERLFHMCIQLSNAAAICFTATSGEKSFADNAQQWAATLFLGMISSTSSSASRCNVSTE